MIEYLQKMDNFYQQFLFTTTLILIYMVITKVVSKFIKRFGKKHDLALSRVMYTIKYFQFLVFVIFLFLFGMIWDISFEGLSVYFLSFFTVAGIGLFASWSILSNITAAIILFFYFPFKIGQHVRIIDGDNSVEGIVSDLNMFSIIIRNDEGHKITYPNNMVLQKGVVLFPE